MDHLPKVSSAKKQADEAKALSKLLARIETNLKARDAKQNGKGTSRSVAERVERPTMDAYNFAARRRNSQQNSSDPGTT
jgi:hypothetical protein